jgi:hypothetical protein
VIRLADGNNHVCADYGEELVFGPQNSVTPKVGLNLKAAAEILRKHAFPVSPAGAAYLRWPAGLEQPSVVSAIPFGVLILFRQTLRMDRAGGWLEMGNTIHPFIVLAGDCVTCDGLDKARLIRGLVRATIRKSAEPAEELICQIRAAEGELVAHLRRPSEDELTNQIRHAVTPLLAAVVTD